MQNKYNTKNSLMNLTDNLQKSDQVISSTMSKISSLHTALLPVNSPPYTLKLPGNQTKEEYLRSFQWSYR